MVDNKRIEHKGQAKLFDNPFLEAMTKTSPAISIGIYGPCIIALLYVAIGVKGLSVATTAAWFFFAIFFWTFAEYVLHRYLFHWYTEADWTKRFHYIVHGVHHEFPKDEERLLMPPVPGLLMASALFGFFYFLFWLAGYAEYTWAFFPGFFLGYLMYSFVHYSIHKFKPPRLFKYIWIHHSIHHYQRPDRAFGVSNYIWDLVFGTMPKKN